MFYKKNPIHYSQPISRLKVVRRPLSICDGCVLRLIPEIRSKWYDYSGKNNHGTIYGATATDGRYKEGLSFDGVDDYVDCGNLPWENESVSLVAWFTNNNVTTEKRIIARGEANGNNPSIQIVDGGVRGIIGHSQEGGGGVIVGSDFSISSNTWYFVVLTFDKNNEEMKLYVNGNLEKTDNAATSIGSTSELLNIGARCNSESFFNGSIDEVRIYNRALSTDEIKNNYEQGKVE